MGSHPLNFALRFLLKIAGLVPIGYAEIREALLPHLPDGLYSGGSTAGWWAKTVQLDLEARGILIREATQPLRWHQV